MLLPMNRRNSFYSISAMKTATKTKLKYLCIYLAGLVSAPLVLIAWALWWVHNVGFSHWDEEISVNVMIPLNEAPYWAEDEALYRPPPSDFIQRLEGVSDAEQALLIQLGKTTLPRCYRLEWNGGYYERCYQDMDPGFCISESYCIEASVESDRISSSQGSIHIIGL